MLIPLIPSPEKKVDLEEENPKRIEGVCQIRLGGHTASVRTRMVMIKNFFGQDYEVAFREIIEKIIDCECNNGNYCSLTYYYPSYNKRRKVIFPISPARLDRGFSSYYYTYILDPNPPTNIEEFGQLLSEIACDNWPGDWERLKVQNISPSPPSEPHNKQNYLRDLCFLKSQPSVSPKLIR